MTTTTVTMSTGGTTVITENDVALALGVVSTNIAAQTTFLASTLAPAPGGVALAGSVAQSLTQSQATLGNIAIQIGKINGNLEKLITATNKTNTEIAQLNKHAGVSNSHANKANVVAQLAVIDQMDKNQFDKQVVTETQIASGQEPTKVQPVDFVANVQKKVQDIVNIDGAMAATGIIIQGAVTATTEGFKLAQEIVLDTAVGKKLVEYYYEAEIAVTGVFSDQKAARLIAENDERKRIILAGGVPPPPVAPKQ
jgi:hypothetical protein